MMLKSDSGYVFISVWIVQMPDQTRKKGKRKSKFNYENLLTGMCSTSTLARCPSNFHDVKPTKTLLQACARLSHNFSNFNLLLEYVFKLTRGLFPN